jgi:hypothetical protein
MSFGLGAHDHETEAFVGWSRLESMPPRKFSDLATTVLTNWISRATEATRKLNEHVSPERSVGIVDDTLGMFAGYRTFVSMKN